MFGEEHYKVQKIFWKAYMLDNRTSSNKTLNNIAINILLLETLLACLPCELNFIHRFHFIAILNALLEYIKNI